MRARQHVPPSLLRLADLQSGVVTMEQAAGAGLSRDVVQRLVGEQRWRRIVPGVYLARDGEPDWTALAWAGVLLGGDHARIGSRAAAHLHGFERQPPSAITVLVPLQVRCRRPGPWEFRRERPGVRSLRSAGSPPRTTVEDTVLDLCDESPASEVVSWVSAAVSPRLTSVDRLRSAADRRRQLRHRALLESVLSDVGDGAESPLEVRYLREVERAHGLPSGRRQVARLRYRSDVSYDTYALLVELDGRLGHEGTGRFRDMWRDNTFVVQGRSTLRYGWHDVTARSCELAAQVARVLTARGWTGIPHGCPRCVRSDLWSI